MNKLWLRIKLWHLRGSYNRLWQQVEWFEIPYCLAKPRLLEYEARIELLEKEING